VNFNLNEEARGDRPHLTPITVSSNTYQFIVVYCQMFLLIHFEIQELFSHNNNKHTNSVRNISRRFCKVPEDFQDFPACTIHRMQQHLFYQSDIRPHFTFHQSRALVNY